MRPSGHSFVVEEGETILESALRSGLAPTYGCANGTCGECMARVVEGEVRDVRFHDYAIGESKKRMGYALLCSVTAVEDTVIEAVEAARPEDIPVQRVRARVHGIERVGDDLMILDLRVQRGHILRFLAGQHVRLSAGRDAVQTLPVGSCHCDGVNLQFHLRRREADPFSAKAFEGLKSSAKLDVEGPWGEFVLRPDEGRPIIFLAYDTGFASIKSIIEHAINLELSQAMHLYWCVPDGDGPYMHNYCRSLADALDNFSYRALTGALDATDSMARAVVDEHGPLAEHDIYLAGPDEFVETASRLLESAGVARERLSRDSPADRT